MNLSSALKRMRPTRLWGSIRRRGVRGAVHQALRRAGMISGRAWTGPWLLRLSPLDFICNHSCPMCWLQQISGTELAELKKKNRDESMRFENYKALFDGFTSGLEEVNVVGGGEPLAHPQSRELIEEIKRRGYRGTLITNGTLLRGHIARALIDSQWDWVRVSVNAGDAETYAKVQGVDRFDLLLENLKSFDQLRRTAATAKSVQPCELIVFHVLQRENIKTIDCMFAMAEQVGADSLVFEPVIPYGEGRTLTPGELREARERIALCAKDSRVPCNLDTVLPQLTAKEIAAQSGEPFRPASWCSVGFEQAFVNSFGDIIPCCFSHEVMGNVKLQPFRQIWSSPKYAEFRNRLAQGRFESYCIENRCSLPEVLHHDTPPQSAVHQTVEEPNQTRPST